MNKELLEFVEDNNKYRNYHNKAKFDIDVKSDRVELAEILASKLSPENLSCDGELPVSKQRIKYKILMKVRSQLIALDQSLQDSCDNY